MSSSAPFAPRRVLLVSNGYPPAGHWGTEYYTRELARGLRARGHEVAVFCPRRDRTRPRYTIEQRVEDGIEVVEIHNAGDASKRFEDSWRNARVAAAFTGLVARWRPEVVHFLHLLWGLSLDLPGLAREAGCATVATATDYGLLCHRGQFRDWREEDCGGPVDAARCARCVREPGRYDGGALPLAAKRLAVRLLAACGGLGVVVAPPDIERRADAVRRARQAVDRWIAPTRSMALTLLAHGWPETALEQFAYGLDERAFALPRQKGEDGTCFGFVGQFAPHKGLARLVEAVRVLSMDPWAAARPWHVEVWGHALGDRNQRYLDAHAAPGLERRLRFMGAFDPSDAGKVMARFDALCVPSQWDENAPLVVLQARAAGLPVLASDVAGVREVLEGVPATLVRKDDDSALAFAMRAVLDGTGPRRHAPAPFVRYDEHLRRVEGAHAAALSDRVQGAGQPAAGAAEC